jgi:hypothetical protein
MSSDVLGVWSPGDCGLGGSRVLRRPDRAALLGLTSAAVATDLANTLYSEWDWVFQLAGIWACSRRGLARASQGARQSCRPATEAQAFRPGSGSHGTRLLRDPLRDLAGRVRRDGASIE